MVGRLIGLALFVLAVTVRPSAAITIDNFEEGPFDLQITGTGPIFGTQLGLVGKNVLGGERQVNGFNSASSQPDKLLSTTLSLTGGDDGANVVFDSPNPQNPSTFLRFNYGDVAALNADLISAGKNAFRILLTDAVGSGTLQVSVFTRTAEPEESIGSAILSITGAGEYLVRYDEFISSPTELDFTDVDTISLRVSPDLENLSQHYAISNLSTVFDGLVGDLDCDGDVDFDDIDDLVLGLRDPSEYENQYGVPPTAKGDLDDDDDLDFDDIPGFIMLLGVGINGPQHAVPEPHSFVLFAIGLFGLLTRCRGTGNGEMGKRSFQ